VSLILFWGAVVLIAYTYLLFPALVFLRSRLSRRPSKTADITPSVSMIIAAHNEANSIGAKLDNLLALDYPRDRLEVIIASDVDNPTLGEQGAAAVFGPQKGATPDDVRRSDAPLALASTAGLAWAARRELLARHGIYDACILGTADRVMAAAALGRFDYGREAILMNGRQWQHYRLWSDPFFKSVQGRVGYVEGRAFHLWHGELRDRRYHERHEGLGRYNFDPFADVALDAGGPWRWNSDKPAMHNYVRDYFAQRDEDGVGRRADQASEPG